MINPTREQIAVALFTLLQSMGSTFASYSRRPATWDNTVPMPALFMGQLPEKYEYRNGTASPAYVTLPFGVWIYGNFAQDPTVIPDTAFNNLLDTLETTLGGVAVSGQPQTLGGIVNHCWIEETVHRAPGWINGKGEIFLTINVVVPS